MKIDNVMTHIEHAEDYIFLRSKLFDVNMRLFHANRSYRGVVQRCCEALTEAALMEYEDYKRPHGISGANLAIPFNIIGIVRERNTPQVYCEIMINPKVLKKYGTILKRSSNCGSIRLPEPIRISRHSTIDLEYFDVVGDLVELTAVDPERGSLTIQHEVDHNNGVLITDYA